MPTGDMIPWTISQQFNDNEFATLSGARIVRIATHPDVQKMGYGSRAIDLLISYFQGEFNDGMLCHLFVISFMQIVPPQMRLPSSALIQIASERSIQFLSMTPYLAQSLSITLGPGPALGEFGGEGAEGLKTKKQKATEEGDLLGEDVKPRAKLPPLLTPLCDLKAEKLHWLGVSFGLTSQLLNFWSRKLFKVRHVHSTDTAPHNACSSCHSVLLLAILHIVFYCTVLHDGRGMTIIHLHDGLLTITLLSRQNVFEWEWLMLLPFISTDPYRSHPISHHTSHISYSNALLCNVLSMQPIALQPL